MSAREKYLHVLSDGSSKSFCVLPPPSHHLQHHMLHPTHFKKDLPSYHEWLICIIPELDGFIDSSKNSKIVFNFMKLFANWETH